MATPYSLVTLDETHSTQDVAGELFTGSPVLVVSARQTGGRGRTGAPWQSAPRAVAASLALALEPSKRPTFSLEGGLAWISGLPAGVSLKWPNDLMVNEVKVGGVLVESSSGVTVIGSGLNLWWPAPPPGIGALYETDPGSELGLALARGWVDRLLEAADRPWDLAGYRRNCSTIGQSISWEPDGTGRAVDISPDGALLVETADGLVRLYAGAVRHVSIKPAQ